MQYSPLTLAYLGDAVLELSVRSCLVAKGNKAASTLHKEALLFVSAKSQSSAMEKLLDKLSEEELAIYKRGRNAKSATVPKNADVSEYRRATGFETLLGFLFLCGEEKRIAEIIDIAFL